RDFHVTGVQTCALPISEAGASYTPQRYRGNIDAAIAAGAGWGLYDQSGFQEACTYGGSDGGDSGFWQCAVPDTSGPGINWGIDRSEERRVGKGRGAGGG